MRRLDAFRLLDNSRQRAAAPRGDGMSWERRANPHAALSAWVVASFYRRWCIAMTWAASCCIIIPFTFYRRRPADFYHVTFDRGTILLL